MAVRDHDERWDELALGHVLGGLPSSDASAFRAHLASCAQCRARVAELRSLDSEMAAAEREERTAHRLRTQLESRDDVEAGDETPARPDPPRPVGRTRWRVLFLVGVAGLVVFGLSVWNGHIRTQNTELSELAEQQGETLRAIGAGSVVPLQTSGSVTGVVAVDGDRVAYVLGGLPAPELGERLVVWVHHPDGPQSVDVHTPSAMEAGRLESTVTRPGATGLEITIESVAVPDVPTGATVLEADFGSIVQEDSSPA